jgi:carbamoyltransferase
MDILGISAFYHDSAACLVRDGRILAAAQEERFTRKKHDSSLPVNAIRYCLAAAKLSPKDLGYVAFYEKPFLKFERLVATYHTHAPRGVRSFLRSIPVWLGEKLWMKDLIQRAVGSKCRIVFPEHHESHAASAFYPSPFSDAAILTIDGVGEWATASFGRGTGNSVSTVAEMDFPHSLGLLYSAFTYFTGFKVNSGEHKLMGLAPYGEPRYRDLILEELIDLREDGSFKLNLRYFNYTVGLTMTNTHFDRLFGGPPRRPESRLTQREMDLARSIQEVTEEVMLRMARHVHRQTGSPRLCLAGGVALNCVGNGRILREGPFEEVWIQPAAGDAGGALGAALFVWHQVLGKPRHPDGRNDSMQGALLGPEYSPQEILAFVKETGVRHTVLDPDELIDLTTQLIADQKVVGWFQGRMEFGPRALGSRSILGDARSPQMQEVMNRRIKFREGFRPFAASVLEEHASSYFDLAQRSPYMLLVAQVSEGARCALSDDDAGLVGLAKLRAIRSRIPSVTHVDYSSRIQTVGSEASPPYRRLLERFHATHGCPVVINTSFNVRGEPIVCTPEEAFRCFMNTNMDALVVGNVLVEKPCGGQHVESAAWRGTFDLD